MEKNKQICVKPAGKLSSTLFEKYLSFFRLIGTFNSETKEWCLNQVKFNIVDPFLLRRNYNAVKEIAELIGFVPSENWEIIVKMVEEKIAKIPRDLTLGDLEAKIVQNEVYLSAEKYHYNEIIEQFQQELCKQIKYFDYKERKYVTRDLCFFNVMGSILRYLRGLHLISERALQQIGFKVKLVNEYNPEISKVNVPSEIFNYQLRSYQVDAISNSLKAIAKVGGALIQLPTGAGKTLIGMTLVKLLMDAGFIKNAFVVVNSKTLAIQWFNVLSKHFDDVGMYTGDEKNYGKVTISTFQSIWSPLNKNAGNDMIESGIMGKFKNTDFVIFDEVHHVPADTFKAVASLNHNIHIGLSATPYREDAYDEVIYGLTSSPVYKLRFSDLLDFLIPPKVYNIRVPVSVNEGLNFLNAVKNAEDENGFFQWNLNEGEIFGEDETSNKNMKYIDFMKGVLWNDKVWKYAVWLANKLVEKGVYPVIIHSPLETPARYFSEAFNLKLLSGKSEDSERKVILEALNSRALKLCVATTVIDEGVDIPSLQSLIMLYPGGSRVKLIQRIGRLVRKAQGKNNAYVFLFNYMTENEWFNNILERQNEKRLSALKEERAWQIVDVSYREVLQSI
ncbi:putative superfamily 2 helicase [Sulfolobus filamentous virus 1]|uniref:Putative superfamily 2 helicase n=1 Tax=Sulfolobus filamentous virus 1 TaxID=2304198 RepID=A0A346LU41_SUFV1|nr:DNA helicase [Sulfolobus filamentous virus 1]AXQ00084.1 putative superfamily 2 helicase [Sulfolobus filamentous virus 1]